MIMISCARKFDLEIAVAIFDSCDATPRFSFPDKMMVV
jgi:hypothetical protein